MCCWQSPPGHCCSAAAHSPLSPSSSLHTASVCNSGTVRQEGFWSAALGAEKGRTHTMEPPSSPNRLVPAVCPPQQHAVPRGSACTGAALCTSAERAPLLSEEQRWKRQAEKDELGNNKGEELCLKTKGRSHLDGEVEGKPHPQEDGGGDEEGDTAGHEDVEGGWHLPCVPAARRAVGAARQAGGGFALRAALHAAAASRPGHALLQLQRSQECGHAHQAHQPLALRSTEGWGAGARGD